MSKLIVSLRKLLIIRRRNNYSLDLGSSLFSSKRRRQKLRESELSKRKKRQERREKKPLPRVVRKVLLLQSRRLKALTSLIDLSLKKVNSQQERDLNSLLMTLSTQETTSMMTLKEC